jgi:hypothetical protein
MVVTCFLIWVAAKTHIGVGPASFFYFKLIKGLLVQGAVVKERCAKQVRALLYLGACPNQEIG